MFTKKKSLQEPDINNLGRIIKQMDDIFIEGMLVKGQPVRFTPPEDVVAILSAVAYKYDIPLGEVAETQRKVVGLYTKLKEHVDPLDSIKSTFTDSALAYVTASILEKKYNTQK